MNQSIVRCRSLGRFARRFLFYLVAAAGTLGVPSLAFCQAQRPNMVVILTDDADFEAFGFNAALYNHPTPYRTPNIDALAQRSVVARQGYAAAPLCSPTRAGLLTGQYQQRYGYHYNIDLMDTARLQGQGLRAEQITMAQYLKGLGYSTGAIGKWHVGFEDGLNLPPDKGFDEFFGFWGGQRHYYFEWHEESYMRRGDTMVESQYIAGGTTNPSDPNANDPTFGRYVTDAFGDEAVAFINRRAAEANPYFLYLAPNATHSPVEAKATDTAQFANVSPEPTQRLAAAAYALDRAVGRVVQAAEASGEPTIIVFMSDNGGAFASGNIDLRGSKGFMWEGGIRVPFFIHMPGVAPGVYNEPISMYDILPTLYAAAGGNVSQLQTDGVDLKPFLSGTNTQEPHDVLVWKTHNFWALRKGDWKLGSPNGAAPVLYNLVNDPAETTDVFAQNPAIVADLVREMTYWESEMDKSRWGPGAGNNFDHFVYAGVNSWLSTAGVWSNAATGETAQLRRADGYPNLILEFQTKNTGGYGGYNSMTREIGQPMMANEVRLTGNFAGQSSTAGGFNGNPLIMVNNLAGAGPKIRLDATSSGTSARFQFLIHSDLQLFDNLEFIGDGTQDFVVTGGLRHLYEPRSVMKTGTSTLWLKGNSDFRGDLVVSGGQVKMGGPTAAINGAHAIRIGSAGSFSMDSGLVEVERIERYGGGFEFTGGELRVKDFVGNLTNQGGNFSPGASAALSTITGNFAQTAGKLTIELGGTLPGLLFDKLDVSGAASLGGTLQVNLLAGFVPSAGNSFEFLTAAGGITGTFANTILAPMPGNLLWQLQYGSNSLRLNVLQQAGIPNPFGDYNGDGVVNTSDYVVWRKSYGQVGSLVADGNGDGRVDDNDYPIWRANFGRQVQPPASGAGVPEPSTIAIAALAIASIWPSRRRCTHPHDAALVV